MTDAAEQRTGAHGHRSGGVVRTAGIDLATQPTRTGCCIITWHGRTGSVTIPDISATDPELSAVIESADLTGIDAPFGWPEPFVDVLERWRHGGAWPDIPSPRLVYRETDRAAEAITGRPPLAVGADRIALTAMRCARLLTRLADLLGHPVDRVDGGDRVVEVYPAAALAVWGLPSRGYGGHRGTDARAGMLATLRDRVRLECTPDTEARLVGDHDTFDALICALIARAAALRLTHRPADPRQRALAATEGWLHVPLPGSLEQLAEP